MELAKKSFAKHRVFYCPLDFTWAMKNAFDRIRPRLLVLIELELWPNWIACAKRSGCRVAIVNGRLSERSFRGYQRWRWFVDPCLPSRRSGGSPGRYLRRAVSCDGSREFASGGHRKSQVRWSVWRSQSSEVAARRNALSLDASAQVWVAGSTQEPEEQIVLEAFGQLRRQIPTLRLILVPRQPESF